MPPYWFVFDLDETLAHVTPYHHLVCSFFLKEFAEDAAKGQPAFAKFIRETPEILRDALNEAYTHFVEVCALQERSKHPLGILRPGVKDVFVKIGELKDAGIAGGAIIYSNNGTRKNLEFIRDIVHATVGRSDLICDVADLWDVRRPQQELQKKVETIKTILKDGPCNTSVDSNDIFFFDDIIHHDIFSQIGERYVRVRPYSYKVHEEKLLNLYFKSLRWSGILTKPELRNAFFEHISGVCINASLKGGDSVETFKEIFLNDMVTRKRGRQYGNAPPMNNSFMPAMKMMDEMLPRQENTLSATQTAGRRKTRRKRRRV